MCEQFIRRGDREGNFIVPEVDRVGPRATPRTVRGVVTSRLTSNRTLATRGHALLRGTTTFGTIRTNSCTLSSRLRQLVNGHTTSFCRCTVSRGGNYLIYDVCFRGLLGGGNVSFRGFTFAPGRRVLVRCNRTVTRSPGRIPRRLFTGLGTGFARRRVIIVATVNIVVVTGGCFGSVLSIVPSGLI